MRKQGGCKSSIRLRSLIVLALAIGWGWGKPHLSAQEGDKLPRVLPTDVSRAVETFRLQGPLDIQLVAAEPNVCDPVAADFDEFGTLFVLEMRGYSENGDAGLGRVRRLRDLDGDGRFEQANVFAEGLQNPTAICCAWGGVIVGDAPELLFLADRDRDGVAEERVVLFVGFGIANIQQRLNNLVWGVDGWLYGAGGGNGGEVSPAQSTWPFAQQEDSPGQPAKVNLRGRDFALDLLSGRLKATTGGGQFGQAIDRWGNRYVCSNSDHCQQIVLDDRLLERNPLLRTGSLRLSIAAEGPAATIYRASPVEAWRVARTELRIQGKAGGPIEGGGRASGYFSGATGICFYDGDALPASYQEHLFVGDAGSNLVHRKRLVDQGVIKQAIRVETDCEFLASTDNWFRPVQMLNAPDGSLMILDMYREVVEHPASLPQSIKSQLDLTSGNDRGRIYRVVPQGWRLPSRRLPGEAGSTTELVEMLDAPNGWHRRTAARLLRERNDPESPRLVREWLARTPSSESRIRAWYLLRDWGALTKAELLAGLMADSPYERLHALRLAAGIGDQDLQAERLKMLTDPDERVRFEAALACGEFPTIRTAEALARAAAAAGGDRWFTTAVLCSAAELRGELLTAYVQAINRSADALSLPLVEELAWQIGGSFKEADERLLAGLIVEALESDPVLAARLWLAGTAGEPQREKRLEAAAQVFSGLEEGDLKSSLIANARQIVTSSETSAEERAALVGMLSALPSEELLVLWRRLMSVQEAAIVRGAAIELLGTQALPELANELVKALPGMEPALRDRAVGLLLTRPEYAAELLDGLEAELVPLVFLKSSQRQQLLALVDAQQRGRAERLFAAATEFNRSAVIESYRAEIAQLKGEPRAGEVVFRQVCASCHQLAGQGSEVGPNLIGYAFKSREDLLAQVLDPNREVDPRYLAYSIELVDGRLLLGVLAEENATSINLRTAAGEYLLLNRSEIEAIRSTSKSLMPDNLADELTPQKLADLSAWLETLRQ